MHFLLYAVFPVVVLLIYFYFRDRQKKEPLRVLMGAFLGGVLSAVAVLLLHAYLGTPRAPFGWVLPDALFDAFVVASIPEEGFKFLFLVILIWRRRQFDEYYDGILYAVYVSLGFACIENILYVYEGGLSVAIGRALLAVPGHALDGVLMGYYFSLARFVPKYRTRYMILSLLVPILAHGIWDFLAFLFAGTAESHPWISILAVVAFFAFVMKLFRIGRRRINVMLERDEKD